MDSPRTARQERDLHAITADGVYFSVMVGLGETYIPAFALAAGLGDIASGLIATLPMLLGALLQMATPFAIRRVGSYRRWVVICARLQAFAFLPLFVGALLGRVSFLWLAIATVGYWTFGLSAGPAWNAWVTTLVPAPIREVFFARRTRAAQAALLGGLLAGGIALEFGRNANVELLVFAGVFALAGLSRLLSSRYLASQSEIRGLAASHRTLGPAGVWRRLKQADSLRVLRYLIAMQVVTNVASPYFTPFMLTHLQLSYAEFMVLTGAAFAARLAVLPYLGEMARVKGFRRVLLLGGVGIVPLPVLWLASSSFWYLLGVQILAGFAWAAVELATALSYFEGIPDEDRASVLSAFNVANAAAIALGSLIGAQLMLVLDASPSLYLWLFSVSAAGRALAAILLRSTPWPTSARPAMGLRTLAIRPSGGSVQRPILAPSESPSAEASRPSDARGSQ